MLIASLCIGVCSVHSDPFLYRYLVLFTSRHPLSASACEWCYCYLTAAGYPSMSAPPRDPAGPAPPVRTAPGRSPRDSGTPRLTPGEPWPLFDLGLWRRGPSDARRGDHTQVARQPAATAESHQSAGSVPATWTWTWTEEAATHAQ